MKAELFAHLPLLRALSAEQRAQLAPHLDCTTHGRGALVWQPGAASESFQLVVSGSVKLVKGESRGTIVEVVAAGGLLCGSAPCTFAPYCCTAIAQQEATEVLHLPRSVLLPLLEGSPALSEAFRELLAERAALLCRRVDELGSGQVERRVAKLLLRLGEEVGEQRSEGALFIPIALTRQDLADMCGTTIETASRLMARWARQSVVKTEPRGFVVLDGVALLRYSRGKGYAT